MLSVDMASDFGLSSLSSDVDGLCVVSPSRRKRPRQLLQEDSQFSSVSQTWRSGCRFENTPATPERLRGSDVDADSDQGPSSFEDVMHWAHKLLRSCLAMLSGQGVNTVAVLDGMSKMSLQITTSYSGIGVAETSLGFLKDALEAQGGQLHYVFHAATDINPRCREMLCSHRQSSRSSHLFGDLLAKLPDSLVEELRQMQAVYKRKFDDAMSCQNQEEAGGSSKRKDAIMKFGRGFVVRALKLLEPVSFTRSSTCDCFRHHQQCPLWPADDASNLHVEVAGNTCTPWSSSGKCFGWLDPASIPCIAWLHSMREVSPSILFNECTPTFDVEILRRLFQDTHHFASHVFGPTAMGIPCNRDRRYTILLRKDRCQGLGILEKTRFQELISARLVASGDMFLRADPEAVAAYINQLAGKRGLPPSTAGSHLPASVVLSPWLKHQLDKYKSVVEHSQRFAGRQNLFVDLSQDAVQRPRVHEVIPCLLRKSFLWSTQARRPLLPLEILAVQCLPVMLPSDNKYSHMNAWSDEFLQGVSRSQIQTFAGNSMVLPAIGSVLLTALLAAFT